MDIAQTQDEAITEASLTLCIIYIYEIIIALLCKSLDLWDTTYNKKMSSSHVLLSVFGSKMLKA